MRHFVYRITDLLNNKKYIGKRSSHSFDVGIVYFTSSCDSEFRKRFKSKPYNFLVENLGEFTSAEDAIKYEIELHDKFDVGINEDFYNRAKQSSSGFDTTGCSGYKRTPELNKKMSEVLTGRTFTQEHKNNISKNHVDMFGENNPMFGADRSGENNPMFGKKHSKETKNKMRVPKKQTTCEFCGREISYNRLTYHQKSKQCTKNTKEI